MGADGIYWRSRADSKNEGLPYGSEALRSGALRFEHYFFGPRLLDYLRELKKCSNRKARCLSDTPKGERMCRDSGLQVGARCSVLTSLCAERFQEGAPSQVRPLEKIHRSDDAEYDASRSRLFENDDAHVSEEPPDRRADAAAKMLGTLMMTPAHADHDSVSLNGWWCYSNLRTAPVFKAKAL